MTEHPIEIKGGAGEFEAAVIAVVLDRIAREESAAEQSRGEHPGRLTAWARALQPEDPRFPRDQVWPE